MREAPANWNRVMQKSVGEVSGHKQVDQEHKTKPGGKLGEEIEYIYFLRFSGFLDADRYYNA